jgi:hypothetical protein
MAAEFIESTVIQNLSALVTLPESYNSCCGATEVQQVFDLGGNWNRFQELSTSVQGCMVIVCECYTLSASPDTLDLSAAPVVAGETAGGAISPTEDLTASNGVFVGIKTPTANVGNVTIKPAAVNGYSLWGTGNTDGLEAPPGSTLYLDRVNLQYSGTNSY